VDFTQLVVVADRGHSSMLISVQVSYDIHVVA